MGRAWSCVGIGLALLGCTRPNLAYDGGGEDTDLGTQGSQGESGLASTSVTTGSGDVADSASSEGPMPSTTTGEMADTDGECVFDGPPLRYGIHRGDDTPLGCMDPFDQPNFGIRLFSADMWSVTGIPCAGCPCNEPGMTLSLNFDAPLPNIPVPGEMEDPLCLTITRALSDMGCELLGYAVIAQDPGGGAVEQLLAAASNELDPGDGVPFEAELLTPLEDCMGTCPGGDDPADYVLELSSEGATAEVSPDAMAWLGEIDVFNDASYIAPNCTEVVRWYAVLP